MRNTAEFCAVIDNSHDFLRVYAADFAMFFTFAKALETGGSEMMISVINASAPR